MEKSLPTGRRSTRSWNLPFHCGGSTPLLLDYKNWNIVQHHSYVSFNGGGDGVLHGEGIHKAEP
jgi:hypothetical protein